MASVADDRSGAAPALLGAADIARLAGVRRPAVSNWRRRFADFPNPVAGTPTHPLFSLADVDRWCREHDRPFRADQGELLWQRVRAEVPDLDRTEFLAYLGGALADGTGRAAGSDVPEAWTALAEEASGCAEPGEVFEELCSRLAGERGRSETDEELAAWMAELAGVTADESVHDPACGVGTLLAAAVALGAARVVGQDRSRHVAAVAAARLAALAPDGAATAGDSLRSPGPGEEFDAVLCDPPFRDREWGHEDLADDPRWVHGLPPRGEGELAWVQHCLSRVRAGGRVVVLLSASVSSRPGGRRIRANLLRAGALRAVLEVPRGAREATRHVWVLERPQDRDGAPGGGVLLVGSTVPLTSSAQGWRVFSSGSVPQEDPRWLVVDTVDLLDGEVDLRPSRYLSTAGVGASVHYPPLLAELNEALEQARQVMLDLELSPGRDIPETTVGALVDSGAVELHRAPMAMSTDAGELSVLTVSDVRAGREATGRSERMPGQVALMAGDVVVAETVRDAPVRLVTEGGAVLGPRLALLRAVEGRIDPAFLSRVVEPESVTSARTSSGRIDVRSLRLPDVPSSEQRAYARSWERLERGGRLLETITDLGGRLTELGHRGLREGELRPRELET
jgi:SAM-dependent methyltransferase